MGAKKLARMPAVCLEKRELTHIDRELYTYRSSFGVGGV